MQRLTGGDFLTSCVTPIPAGACIYDVLASPDELGLQTGDNIHVKDLKTLEASRGKTIGDLLAEAPRPLTSRDVVELTAVHNAYYEKSYSINYRHV